MTWADLKTLCQTIYGQYVGSGKLIDDSNGDDTTPSSLAILMNLVHNRIIAYPKEFEFLKETSTITLDGSTSYNLKTLLPSLRSVYQIYGIDQYKEHQLFGNWEGNITPIDGYLIRGDSLVFTGTAPISGTASIQYKSRYMVKSAAGTRKQYFLKDDDYSVLDDGDINVLIFGLVDFINWKSDTETGERKKELKDWYKEAWTNLILANKQTSQLHSML